MRRLVAIVGVRLVCDLCGEAAFFVLNDDEGALRWRSQHLKPRHESLVAEVDCACPA